MEIWRRNPSALSLLLLLLSLVVIASAEDIFEARFDDGWEKHWVISERKRDENTNPNYKGFHTSDFYRFYAVSAEFPEFSNKGKTLVFQFSFRNEDDQKKFGVQTLYSIFLGDDICGLSNVHAILHNSAEINLIEQEVPCETDQRTHVYTFILRPDANYSILIDNQEKQSGTIYKDLNKKPEDWDDDKEYILNPEEKKKLEILKNIPKEIPDPTAKKPKDWDDEEDGEWTARNIPIPKYIPKLIKNPYYKGKWKTPINPDWMDDPNLNVYPNLKYVSIELYQVKFGIVFDKVLISDDPVYAKKVAEEILGKQKDAEKAAFDKAYARSDSDTYLHDVL